jgi:PAS domain S-box-containing protein
MTRILVVEDEASIARNLTRVLTGMGYHLPPIAESSEAALLAMQTERPDLVLMDIRIAGETDGIETAIRIKSRYDLPIVFLTALFDDETLQRAMKARPSGYLLKPFNENELRTTVEVVLHRHRLERQLQEREKWLEATLSSIGDAVIAVDGKRHIQFMNRVAEELTGWDQEAAEGRPVGEVLRLRHEHTGEPLTGPVEEAFRTGKVALMPTDTLLLTRSNAVVPIDDSVGPIPSREGGEPVGAVVVFRDARPQRRIRAEADRTERLSALGTLAAGVGHEINNPLAYLFANLGYVQDELNALQPHTAGSWLPNTLLDELKAALRDAHEGANKVRLVVDDLRLFARGPGPGHREAQLNDALQAAVRMSAGEVARLRAKVELRLDDKLPPAAAPEGRLVQVAVNLLVNAAQALDPDRKDPDHRATLVVTSGMTPRGRICFSVLDQGRGMTPETQARLFEPFFSTRAHGTGSGPGLGLFVCYSIVTGLGGNIRYETVLDQGTTFHVELPVLRTFPSMTSTDQAARVLVVDPDPNTGLLVHQLLAGTVEVRQVSYLAEAEALLGDTFQVLLCDADEMYSTQQATLQHLRQRDPELMKKVVLLCRPGTPTLPGMPSVEKPLQSAPLFHALNLVPR